MYEFDTVVDRRNTGALKWDVAKNELPMWVADMDFCDFYKSRTNQKEKFCKQ